MFRNFPGGDAGRKLSLRIPSIMDHVQILMCCSCIVGFWWSWWVFSDSEKILRSWGKQGLFMTFILGDGSSIFLLPQFSEGDKSHLLSPSPIPLQQDPWKIRDKSPNKDFPLTAPQNHQIHPKAQFFSPHPEGKRMSQRWFCGLWGGKLGRKKTKKTLQGCEVVVTSGWKVTLLVTKNFCPDHEDFECKWRGLRWTSHGTQEPQSHFSKHKMTFNTDFTAWD